MTAKVEDAPAAPIDAGAILKAIQDLGSRVDALQAEQAQAAARSPRFAPMQREVKPLQPDTRPDARGHLVGMRAGGERSGSEQVPVDYHGQRVDTRQFRQAFRAGQAVRINREASRGSCKVINHPAQFVADDAGKQHLVTPARRELIPLTWGQVLDGLSGGGIITCPTRLDEGGATCGERVAVGELCPACGAGPTVKSARMLTKQGWKYVVRVPGLTRHAGDGFMEWEILPA
jgi:hypothetical protein